MEPQPTCLSWPIRVPLYVGLGRRGERRGASARSLLVELVVFGARRTSACLFPRIFISILLPSNYVPLFGLAR